MYRKGKGLTQNTFRCVRFGLHRKYPGHWHQIRGLLDRSMMLHFEEQATTRVKVVSYLVRRRSELAMWMPNEQVIPKLVAAKGNYTTCPSEVQIAMSACQTCRAMFSIAWLGCSRELFLEKLRTQLRDLESSDFAPDADKLFQEYITDQSQRLRNEGHRRGAKKWATTIKYLGHEVPYSCDYAGDQWEHEYWARLKTILVNNGQLKALPWERLLCVPGQIQDTPTQLKIADSVADQFYSLRLEQAEILNGKSTLDEMIFELGKHYNDLLDCHKSFELEFALLQECGPSILENQVHFAHTEPMQHCYLKKMPIKTIAT